MVIMTKTLKEAFNTKALHQEGLFISTLLLSLFFILSGCSGTELRSFFGTNERALPIDRESNLEKKDFIDQLSYLTKELLNNPDVKIERVRGSHERYLKEIYTRIVLNNELLLDPGLRPTFYLIKHSSPLVFSLPKAQFFISNALINRYIKNEEILVAALTYQIIKSHRNMYEEKSIIPVGVITLEKLLGIGRIPLTEKNEIHKWSYLAMKRAGFDESAYLNWLQTLNKSSIDFSLMTGDPALLAREEFTFKSFMIKQKVREGSERVRDYNSSAEFYRFINYVSRTI